MSTRLGLFRPPQAQPRVGRSPAHPGCDGDSFASLVNAASLGVLTTLAVLDIGPFQCPAARLPKLQMREILTGEFWHCSAAVANAA